MQAKKEAALRGDVGQIVMGDVHQSRNFHKQLSAALVAVTCVCGWSLYQNFPEGDSGNASQMEAHCYFDGKLHSEGKVTKIPDVGI